MGLVTPVVLSKACSVGPSPPRLPLKGRRISALTRPIYFMNEIVFSNRFDYIFKGRGPEQLHTDILVFGVCGVGITGRNACVTFGEGKALSLPSVKRGYRGVKNKVWFIGC